MCFIFNKAYFFHSKDHQISTKFGSVNFVKIDDFSNIGAIADVRCFWNA